MRFLFLLFFAVFSMSFTISPMVQHFSKEGRSSSRRYFLSNKTETPKAIQITIKKRSVPEVGEEILTDGEEDFSIYPKQLVLMPNDEQSVQVTFLNSKNSTKEEAYRLIAEELPIDLNSMEEKVDQGGFHLLMRYMTAVYVRPKGAMASVVLERCEKKDKQLFITLKNQGRAHTILQDFEMDLIALDEDGKKLEDQVFSVEKKMLSSIDRKALLAESIRTYTLEWPKECSFKYFTCQFRFIPSL